MNHSRYLLVCWTISYIFVFVSLMRYAWQWADSVGTLDALLFWLGLTLAFGGIGLWLVRSIKDNL